MRNYIVIIGILATLLWITGSVAADTLYDLYTDHSTTQPQKQITTKKQTTNTSSKNYNNTYMPNFYSQNQTFKNPEELVKKGSLNYGEYGTSNKRTNPVRIGNPYNHLNEKYVDSPITNAAKYTGNAVRFKKGADGNIYGYDKYGQKIGIYRVNNNGTTTEFKSGKKQTNTFR